MRVKALLTEIEHKPFAGDLPHDVTCFHADYEHSGPDRADWPRILYQYKKDNIFPSVVRPKKLLTPEGYVVLNKDDEPILDFPGLPLTISSRCEGWRLEAFCRSNKWVTSKQIRSRMPGNVSIKLNKLSMRRTRFRRKAGAIAWDTAGGASEAFEAYIDAKLPQVCKAANSIESFRDLYPHEIAEMELQNLGRYPGRARGRTDTSAENFQRKRDTALAEYNRLKAEFDSRNSQERGEGNTASDGGSSEGATTANGKDRDSLYPSEGGEDLIRNRNEPILDPAPDNGSGEQGHQDQAESRENSGLGPTNGSASVAEQIGSIDCSDDENESEKDGGSREEDRSGTEGSVSLLSVEASDSEADNILYQDPATDAESQLVQRLLQPTKDHFEWLVGSAPPSTDPTRSYIYQWGDIATAWQQHWESYGPEGQPDLLIGLIVFRADTVEWNMCSEEIPPSGLELGDLSGLDELVFRERALRSQA